MMSTTNKKSDNTVAVESPDGRDMQGSPGPPHDPQPTSDLGQDAVEDDREQTPDQRDYPDAPKGDGPGSDR
jgi:hypothetical protein